MAMENLGWGFTMLVFGMGTVFLMLFVLMFTLMLLNRTDKEPAVTPAITEAPGTPALTEGEEAAAPEEDPNAWMTISDASGLTPEQIAAISVAVAVHADVRRKQAAPVHRVHAPGSRLWASRWVSMGRSSQMHNTQRR